MKKMRVKVKLFQKKNEIVPEKDLLGDFLLIKTTAKPINDEANDEILKLLASYFDVAVSSLRIKSGFSSTTKIINLLF